MYGFVILALIAPSFGAPANDLDNRIVGGNPSTIEKHPYQAALYYLGSFTCGGSIISPRFIISAAHCVYEQAASSYTVRVGSNTTKSDGQVFSIEKFYINPLFNAEVIDYDISILYLSKSIQFGPSALPIALAPSNLHLSPGQQITVTGWGTLAEGGELAKELQEVDIPYIDNKECQEAYRSEKITSRMLCARGDNGGKDACQGDSGGPVVSSGYLVGIVSWGYGCGRPQYPGVYSRVSELRDFIKNITQL